MLPANPASSLLSPQTVWSTRHTVSLWESPPNSGPHTLCLCDQGKPRAPLPSVPAGSVTRGLYDLMANKTGQTNISQECFLSQNLCTLSNIANSPSARIFFLTQKMWLCKAYIHMSMITHQLCDGPLSPMPPSRKAQKNKSPLISPTLGQMFLCQDCPKKGRTERVG